MSIEQFVHLLVSSKLSNTQESDELVARFRAQTNRPDDVESFCAFLVESNLFTDWQCSKLRLGKWKGFYLGNYLLLDHIGKDADFSYFLGRDSRDGKLVLITVSSLGEDIKYRVEQYVE